MKSLEWAMHLSVAMMAGLAGVILAVAEGMPLAALTLPLCIVSVYFVDHLRQWGLSAGAAFALGLLALAAALFEVFTGDEEAKLLGPAHLVVYLTWIFLLQRKQSRHCWWLCGLSVLQIAIASLLTSDVWLGPLLIAYLFLSLWTLTVFTLWREVSRAEQSDSPAVPREAAGSAFGDGRSPAASLMRKPSSKVRSGVQRDPGERWISRRLVGGTTLLTLCSLGLASAFFLLIPRMWIGRFQVFDNSPLEAARSLVGFSDEVRLGDIGEILESSEPVMEIRCFDNDNGRPLSAREVRERFGTDLLIRGTCLEQYENGSWQRLFVDPRYAYERTRRRGTVRQRITLQPLGSLTLFGAGEVLACRAIEPEEAVITDGVNRTFSRHPRRADLNREIVYDAISVGDGTQLRGMSGFFFMTNRSDEYTAAVTHVPPGLTRVRSLAREIVGDARDAAEKARRLEAWLKDSGQFEYSLSLAVDDPTIDPIEDFLINRKRGHCEYYASSLALLLRTVDVPARLVGGFKGGLIHPSTGVVQVRQLHAHAWTEAFVGDGWLPLDPTPAARDESVEALERQDAGGLSRLSAFSRQWWTTGVSLSSRDQQEYIYKPLSEVATDFWGSLSDIRGSFTRFGTFLRSLVESPERWISWRGGLTALILLLCLAAVVKGVRSLWRWFRRRRARAAHDAGRALLVPFYERYRQLLHRGGLERAPHQTQREFADRVTAHLNARLEAAGLAALPADLTDWFYRVRFGEEELPAAVEEQLEQRLAALARVVTP